MNVPSTLTIGNDNISITGDTARVVLLSAYTLIGAYVVGNFIVEKVVRTIRIERLRRRFGFK